MEKMKGKKTKGTLSSKNVSGKKVTDIAGTKVTVSPSRTRVVRNQARSFPTHHLKKSFDKNKEKSAIDQTN